MADGMNPPVAIIGGGWAGCAAAVTLARAGVPVTVFETAPVLGGRARRVLRAGLPLDNGQHLLLGAYEQTCALLDFVHGDANLAKVFIRTPLSIMPLADDQAHALTLVRGRAEGSLGLLTGLLNARGLTWRERIANISWMRKLKKTNFVRTPYETVAQMLGPLPRTVAQGLWEPLCLAALNTPTANASAQIFANVLKASFAGRPNASDFLLPATDLTAMFPAAAARYIESRGGAIRTLAPARVVRAAKDMTTLLVGTTLLPFRAAVVACGPHQVAGAFAPEALAALPAISSMLAPLSTLAYEPIYTVWLGFETALAIPAPIVRLDDAPGQWVVDRPDIVANAQAAPDRPVLRQILAVILSASGPHEGMDHGALALDIDDQLRRLQPERPPCVWYQVIAERRATYACTPGRARPADLRVVPGVYLAGDYMDAEYPATLEAAVRSGVAAAQAVLHDITTDSN
jgi:hydroxysqualene dehydroxylase